SIVALWLALMFRSARRSTMTWIGLKFGSALVMGIAIVSMHYTGMLAASFSPASLSPLSNPLNIESLELGGAIGFMTIVILGLALLFAFIDRRFSARIAAFESLFLRYPDAVYGLDLCGVIRSANPAAGAMTGYRVDELSHTHFTALMSAEDAER